MKLNGEVNIEVKERPAGTTGSLSAGLPRSYMVGGLTDGDIYDTQVPKPV
jgi:hypothetical protein